MYIIGGKFKKKPLFIPETEELRPTTGKIRETIFNICQGTVEDAEFLDLFAGSGAIGLEAISRGAKHVTFVEKGRHIAKAIKQNIEKLNVENQTTIIVADAFNALEDFGKNGTKFDIIFADPPYGVGLGEQALEFVDRLALLKEGGEFFIEDEESPKSLDITLKNLELKSTRKIGRTWLRQFIAKPQVP